MPPRLASGLLVSALIRRISDEGGSAAVVYRGDATSGAILLLCCERGAPTRLVERTLGPDDAYRWAATGPQDIEDMVKISDYLARRRASDPDLWVVELDIANAERFAAEMIGEG